MKSSFDYTFVYVFFQCDWALGKGRICSDILIVERDFVLTFAYDLCERPFRNWRSGLSGLWYCRLDGIAAVARRLSVWLLGLQGPYSYIRTYIHIYQLFGTVMLHIKCQEALTLDIYEIIEVASHEPLKNRTKVKQRNKSRREQNLYP